MTSTPPDAVHDQAVRALTAAARATHNGDRLDVAGFLAAVITAAAANTGSIDALLAGRPGSWEADLIRRLVTGTAGPDETDLDRYRTEPVTIRLCVGEIAADHHLPHLDDALDDADDADDADDDGLDVALAIVEDRYRTAFTAYGHAVTAAVHAAAARRTQLTVPVVAEVDTDPNTAWWTPTHTRWTQITTDDCLATELAATALRTLPPLALTPAAQPTTDPSTGSPTRHDPQQKPGNPETRQYPA